jgi:hypothetical protein
LKEPESALPLVAALHGELPSSPQQEQVVVELPAPHVKAAIIVSAAPPSLICTTVVPAAPLIITPEQISLQPAFLFKMVAPSILELKNMESSANWPQSVSLLVEWQLRVEEPGLQFFFLVAIDQSKIKYFHHCQHLC